MKQRRSVDLKALVIINPCAGKNRGKSLLFPITDALCKAGYTVTVHITQEGGDATRVIEQDGEQYDQIICCGGDGTFQETVNGVLHLEKRPEVGYIPCGTTNDLSKTLNIPANAEKNIENILEGTPKPLDIGVFNGRNFTYIASFGTFSSVSYETPQSVKNVLGHTAYVLNGIGQVFKIHPIHLRWTCDDLKGEGDYFFGGVSNTTSIGGVYKLPSAAISLDDGMFELILIESRNSNLELLPDLLAKRYNEASGNRILILKGKHFTLSFDEEIPFTLDGEYGGSHKFVEIQCLQGAVNMISADVQEEI